MKEDYAMIFATLLIAGVILGPIVLLSVWSMPVVYPTVVTYAEASTRVAIEQATVTVSALDYYVAGSGIWTSTPFPLKKGETVTVEFDVTPRPSSPTYYTPLTGVSLYVTRGMTGYSSIFYAWYGVNGMSLPNECIVPETGDYLVGIMNWEKSEEKVSFKLTVRSTAIVGGADSVTPPVRPYGKTQTLVMLWWLLGVGMLVGAVCALLVRPKEIVQPVPSPSLPATPTTPPSQVAAIEQPVQMKFCRECGAKIPRDSNYCEECGAKLQ